MSMLLKRLAVKLIVTMFTVRFISQAAVLGYVVAMVLFLIDAHDGVGLSTFALAFILLVLLIIGIASHAMAEKEEDEDWLRRLEREG